LFIENVEVRNSVDKYCMKTGIQTNSSSDGMHDTIFASFIKFSKTKKMTNFSNLATGRLCAFLSLIKNVQTNLVFDSSFRLQMYHEVFKASNKLAKLLKLKKHHDDILLKKSPCNDVNGLLGEFAKHKSELMTIYKAQEKDLQIACMVFSMCVLYICFWE
jgi:hypothetical protein